MKFLTPKNSILVRFVLAIALMLVALLLSNMMNKGLLKRYFPYLPCILLFVVTWVLFKTEKRSIREIGLNVNLKNMSFLPLGVLVGMMAFFGAKCLSALYLGETIRLNTSIDFLSILYAFYFILPQVATEELLFRGYIFKKTIEVSNVTVANMIFSILFMLIHVLDEGVLSNTGMIIMLVVSIPVGHLLFATALLKSKTIFFPIGIHLGNNWATRHLINNSKLKDSVFYVENGMIFETWPPFIISLLLANGFFLLVTFVIWKWDKFSISRYG